MEEFIGFLNWLDQHPGPRPTQANYRQYTKSPGVPSASRIGKQGGHNRLLARAQRMRREWVVEARRRSGLDRPTPKPRYAADLRRTLHGDACAFRSVQVGPFLHRDQG